MEIHIPKRAGHLIFLKNIWKEYVFPFNHRGKLRYLLVYCDDSHGFGIPAKLSKGHRFTQKEKWIPEHILRWLKYLLVIVERPMERGNLSFGNHPQLLYTSRYQMLIVTDLQLEKHVHIELILRKYRNIYQGRECWLLLSLTHCLWCTQLRIGIMKKKGRIPWVRLLGTEQGLESVPPQHPNPTFQCHKYCGLW